VGTLDGMYAEILDGSIDGILEGFNVGSQLGVFVWHKG